MLGFCLINTVGCNADLVVVIICLSCGLNGLSGAGTSPNYVELAPKYAGLLHGICDSCYSAIGFVIPLAVGAIIKGISSFSIEERQISIAKK